MANEWDQFKKAPPSDPWDQFKPAGEVGVVEDVLKSGASGVAKGVVSLPGIPGNLESLARTGIDWAAPKLGFDNPQLSGDTLLPTSDDIVNGVEGVAGEFYKPQTTAGKYANTIGEFIPGSVAGPGGLVTKLVGSGVAPAVASEFLGQQFEGTDKEGIARAGGALLTPFALRAGSRVVTPLPAKSDEYFEQARRLEQEGVRLSAGDRSGNDFMRATEAQLGSMPGSGNAYGRFKQQQGEDFTEAAMERAGETARRAGADEMDAAFTRLGQQFDDLAARNFTQMDQPLDVDLNTVWINYQQMVNESARRPVVFNTINDIYNELGAGQRFTGERYAALRTRLDKAARESSDTETQNALFGIRNALDENMQRHMSADDAAAWAQARREYRNLMPISDAAAGAGADTANGLLAPSQLRTAVKNQNKRDYVRGDGDLSLLARDGEAVLRPLPNSGTPIRVAPQALFSSAMTAGGMAVGGIPGAAAAATASTLGPGMIGRTILSNPGRRLLGNQVMTPFLRDYDPRRAVMVQLLQGSGDAEQGLRGGIGPRYDAYGNLIR